MQVSGALQDQIASVQVHGRYQASAGIAVVVVAYRSNRLLLECLDSLRQQSCREFQTIVVDNGGNDAVQDRLKSYDLLHVRMAGNAGCSAGKNVGALQAKAEIVCFIDDDARAHPDFVLEHRRAYRTYPEAMGVRGKVLPKDPANIFNGLVWHYDLGDQVFRIYIDAETNCSFRRSAFLGVGGFASPVIRGDSEGVGISYRIVQACGSRDVLIYYPAAVVYHDYATDLRKLLRKIASQARAKRSTEGGWSGLAAFIESYHVPTGTVHPPRDFSSRVRLAAVRRLLRFLGWYYRACR